MRREVWVIEKREKPDAEWRPLHIGASGREDALHDLGYLQRQAYPGVEYRVVRYVPEPEEK